MFQYGRGCPGIMSSGRGSANRPDFELPLTSTTSPSEGPIGAASIVRAGSKMQQLAAATAYNWGANTTGPCSYFAGAAANGLPVEEALTNLLTETNFATMNDWTKAGVTTALSSQAGPDGSVGAVLTATPTAESGYLAYVSSTDCSSKRAFASIWIRNKDGASGTHPGIILMQGNTSLESFYCEYTITSAWQEIILEATTEYNGSTEGFSAGAGTLGFALFPGALGTTAVDIWLPYVEVFSNSLIQTLRSPQFTTSAIDKDSWLLNNALRGDQGTLYMEVYPLHLAEDGVERDYLSISPLYAADANSEINLYKDSTNNLYLFYESSALNSVTTTGYALNDTNFARATWHKLAIKWGSAGLSVFLDGAKVDSTGAITVGAATLDGSPSLKLGNYDQSIPPSAVMRMIKGWKIAKSDAELIAMTT